MRTCGGDRYQSLTSFFPIVDTCLCCEDTARQSCTMVPKWRFFASCIFSEQRAALTRTQNVSEYMLVFVLCLVFLSVAEFTGMITACHGLYGSTSCCISQWPSQWEGANSDPPQLRNRLPMLMKFEP